jgi:hypothetical protein
VTPFEVYRDYLALKNHFNNPKYDYFRYNGKSGASPESFSKRKDAMFFQKLAKHRDPHGLMLANFIKNPKLWIRDIAYSEGAEQTYLDWTKRIQSLTYLFKSDMSKLDTPFDSNLIVKDNDHPTLLKLLLSEAILPETVCIIADLTGCTKYWDRELAFDPVWDEMGTFIKKYTPFVKYDREKIKKTLVDFFSE